MKLKIRSQYTDNAVDYEKNSGISETVPDSSMGIPEILRRFTKGQPIYASSRTPYYDSENDFEEVPDLATMDLSEQADYYRATAQRVADLRKKFQFTEEKKRMDGIKSKLREELKAELEERKASFIPSKGDEKPDA